MIYVHSIGRAVRYYPHQPALTLSDDSRVTFVQLHDRVRRLAAALTQAGFLPGDRLALLLPNGPDYIELVYACSWLGIIAVPINTRLSPVEIERAFDLNEQLKHVDQVFDRVFLVDMRSPESTLEREVRHTRAGGAPRAIKEAS